LDCRTKLVRPTVRSTAAETWVRISLLLVAHHPSVSRRGRQATFAHLLTLLLYPCYQGLLCVRGCPQLCRLLDGQCVQLVHQHRRLVQRRGDRGVLPAWLQSALQVVQATLHHLMIVASHWPVQQKHDQAETTAWGLLQGCRQSPGRLNSLYVRGYARMHTCMSVADAPPP